MISYLLGIFEDQNERLVFGRVFNSTYEDLALYLQAVRRLESIEA